MALSACCAGHDDCAPFIERIFADGGYAGQKMAKTCMDQSQSPLGSRLRALLCNCRCVRPPRHDLHHAQAACCKRLVMNPNFPDGL